MGSKSFLFLGLAIAMVLLISSEVSARDLAETTNSLDATNEVETNGVEDAKYPGGGWGGGGYPGGGWNGGGGRWGGGGGRWGGGGGRWGGGGGRWGGGGGCGYGCCGRGYYGGCRCCSYAGQAVDADFEP